MTWSFRKRIKIIPGVHLNLSKNGISTSIGIKGASVTIGKAGTYLNTSIPLTGINYRQKIDGSPSTVQPTPFVRDWISERSDNIYSADIHEVTSQNMQGIKETILLAQSQRKEMKNDLLKIQTSLAGSKIKYLLSYIFIYGLIRKTIPENLRMNIKAQKEAIEQTNAHIDQCYVKLAVDFEPEIREAYDKLIGTFKKLLTCRKIWDVTSAHFQDRVATRSSASTLVEKRAVKFGLLSLDDIRSDYDTLHFENANGADFYFYPTFIVMYSNAASFAIIGIDEIMLEQSYVRFTETGAVPQDAKIIDKTWLKVNKNGSPDKRFKGNYQIPVVRYGQIRLRTNTGVNEEYEFSNAEFTGEFGEAFRDYQQMIKRLKKL